MEAIQQFPLKYVQSQSPDSNQGPKIQGLGVTSENNGKWSALEHAKYIAFIDHHKDKMRTKSRRRFNKFYKLMSEFVKSRNALQCRSHHQKLEQKYKFPNKIIANYKKHNDLEAYQRALNELKSIQPLEQSEPSNVPLLMIPNLENLQPEARQNTTPVHSIPQIGIQNDLLNARMNYMEANQCERRTRDTLRPNAVSQQTYVSWPFYQVQNPVFLYNHPGFMWNPFIFKQPY